MAQAYAPAEAGHKSDFINRISRMSKAEKLEQEPQTAESEEARDFAVAVARIAAENKTAEVEVLDLRGLSGFADFFVLGTGTSERQMHAVVDLVEDYARRIGRSPFRVADSREAHWILTDYVDVVLHLFDAEHRDYYDLSNLWGDAPRVQWEPQQGT
jgi:ribosome-associated protein